MSVKSLFKFQAPPNTRMQPTAFGARDRRYFGTSLCGAPAAADDAQSVRPRQDTSLSIAAKDAKGSYLFVVFSQIKNLLYLFGEIVKNCLFVPSVYPTN